MSFTGLRRRRALRRCAFHFEFADFGLVRLRVRRPNEDRVEVLDGQYLVELWMPGRCRLDLGAGPDDRVYTAGHGHRDADVAGGERRGRRVHLQSVAGGAGAALRCGKRAELTGTPIGGGGVPDDVSGARRLRRHRLALFQHRGGGGNRRRSQETIPRGRRHAARPAGTGSWSAGRDLVGRRPCL